MLRLATWIRAKDQKYFQRSFAFAPEVELWDGRVSAVNVAQANGLLLTGGGDIAADFLRQKVPHPSAIRGPDRRRDAWEFAAVRTAMKKGLPILAICRGHQVLNVALGGTLLLDIPGHRQPPALAAANRQALRYAPRVPASRVFARVNSTHHQAVDRPGRGLVVEAWAAADGVVEQVRHRSHPWCVGVQYHPERSPAYAPLFGSLVEAIRAAAP